MSGINSIDAFLQHYFPFECFSPVGLERQCSLSFHVCIARAGQVVSAEKCLLTLTYGRFCGLDFVAVAVGSNHHWGTVLIMT